MKKISLLASSILLLFAFSACSNEDKNDAAQAKQAEAFPTGTNFRYIDMDSITEHYNLAKDYKEWLIKKNESLEKQVRSLYASVQRFEAECQKKAQANGYLTEASYKADLQKYQNMATNAAKKEQELRRQASEEDSQWTQKLQDSINSYVIDYNAEFKYDAILFKNAGIFFNPSLDVTKDIIDGLNARYNRISTSDDSEKVDSTKTKEQKVVKK